MKPLTLDQLRANLDALLDQILETGQPLEIKHRDRTLRIVPVTPVDKLQNLVDRPDVINGDPDDLVNITW